ncbi:MAG: proteasome activator [Actinomycetota bacterium]
MSEQPEAVQSTASDAPDAPADGATESVGLDPQKLIRIASVTREVLDEARRIRPEPGAVDHLRRFHERVCTELKESLPPELYKELDELTPDIKEGSLEELALGHAEILGWLEGLFQGTQIAMQMQAMRAFQEAQRRQLPEGSAPPGPDGQPPAGARDPRYL